jgi:hypothetical protein
MSPFYSQHIESPRFSLSTSSFNLSAAAEDGYAKTPSIRFVKAKLSSAFATKPFAL